METEPSDTFRMTGTLLLLVRSLEHRLREHSPDDLALADLSVLRQIQRGRDLPSAVARALQLDPGRVSRIVDGLVGRGYISREQDAVDRRCWHLSLTEAGKARLDMGRDDIRATMNDLLSGLSKPDRQALEMGLEAVRRDLELPITTSPASTR